MTTMVNESSYFIATSKLSIRRAVRRLVNCWRITRNENEPTQRKEVRQVILSTPNRASIIPSNTTSGETNSTSREIIRQWLHTEYTEYIPVQSGRNITVTSSENATNDYSGYDDDDLSSVGSDCDDQIIDWLLLQPPIMLQLQTRVFRVGSTRRNGYGKNRHYHIYQKLEYDQTAVPSLSIENYCYSCYDDDEDSMCPAECAICLQSFACGITVTTLPCGHEYHTKCVIPWLTKQCTCPECRQTIV